MSTEPMKKMNKSQKKKLKRLAMRIKQYDLFCKTINGYANANRKPGAVR